MSYRDDKNITVFDFVKKEIVAVFSMEHGKLNGHNFPVSYFQHDQLVILRYGSRYIVYDAQKELFSLLAGGENVAAFHQHGAALILNTESPVLVNGKEVMSHYGRPTTSKVYICNVSGTSTPRIICDRKICCSCRLDEGILILDRLYVAESEKEYGSSKYRDKVSAMESEGKEYFDTKRNSAIDVGNFVCWLPSSLSFFEYQSSLKMTIMKRFSKEPDSQERCVVCFEDLLNRFALLPCGHTQFCESCIKKIDNCHLCQSQITSTLRIF